MSSPREWYLNPIVGYKCEVNEKSIGLTGNEIHVIEFSAYETAIKERDEARADLRDCYAVLNNEAPSHEARELMKQLTAERDKSKRLLEAILYGRI